MIHRNLRALCERLLILPALVLCIGSPGAFAAAVGGGTYYVSGAGDDAAGDGSEANPWRTITHAVDQAGGNAPTIMVGAGNYSPDDGESLPIQIDQHDDAGISIQGPGDGSAVLDRDAAPLLGSTWSIFDASSYITGEVVIDGLDVVSNSGSGTLLDMEEGAANVTINDIHADGGRLQVV